jgi:ATP-binding cassette subfamily B protein
LRDVAFTAAPGKVTAIVGPSGSGKTTLLRLAAGFWKPDRGTVEVDGVDLQAIASDALAQRIGYVFQDVFLLNDTIAENLRIGNPDATDEQIQGAAQAARAHEFISALPDGYETMVGDRGLNLSRGERQRLQIARALLKDAPILLLDEPTASVDPATEWEIQQSLNALLRGKTVLAVTHRLGTIVDADQIVVLDRDGRIEASGTHAQLLENSLTYARLWSDYSGAIDWIAAEGASAP